MLDQACMHDLKEYGISIKFKLSNFYGQAHQKTFRAKRLRGDQTSDENGTCCPGAGASIAAYINKAQAGCRPFQRLKQQTSAP